MLHRCLHRLSQKCSNRHSILAAFLLGMPSPRMYSEKRVGLDVGLQIALPAHSGSGISYPQTGKVTLKEPLTKRQYNKSPIYTRVPFRESPTQPRYPTNIIGYVVLYRNRLIILFAQIIHKKTKVKQTLLILQYTSTVQQLACRGWHRVNRQEEVLAGGGSRSGRWWS